MRTGKRPIEYVIQVFINYARKAVEARGRFAARGLTSGNQLRRWHGANRNCNIGDNGRTSFCSSPLCSLCCIIRTSFSIAHSRKKTRWGRFGNGIYTSSTSSKSVGYSSIVTIVLTLLFPDQMITARTLCILGGKPSFSPTWLSEMPRSSQQIGPH